MLEGCLGGQLLGLKSLFLTSFIEHHFLSQLAWVGQVDNVAVGSNAKSPFVPLAMVLQSAASDPDIKSFFKIIKLRVVHLAMPNLTAIINHAHLAHEVVNLEKLQHFALEIEVLVEHFFVCFALLHARWDF